MSQIKQNIIIKISAILIVLAVLLPYSVSLIHHIEHEHEHKYELCDNHNETHLHKLENDCDFYKFKINQGYHLSNINNKIVLVKISTKALFESYSFSYNHQNLSFLLRAPPLVG